MKTAELNRMLADLHGELVRTQRLDAETKNNLRALFGDIQNLLQGKPAQPGREKKNLIAALDDHVLKLEAGHPSLSSAIEHLVDMLSGMGI